MPEALIVGAGLGGLAAAACLATRGWKVEVHEAAEGPGGKAGSWTQDGFRFDTGPSLVTMTAVFDELFTRCGEQRTEQIDFVELEQISHLFWDDGRRMTTAASPAVMAAALHKTFGEADTQVKKYFRKTAALWKLTSPLFLERSLHEASTWLSPASLRGILAMPTLETGTILHKLHCRYFKSDQARQIFDRLATYNGSSPYLCPGTLAVIAHAEYGLGGYAVRGGIRQIPETIEALARRKGAVFHYGSRVKKIIITEGRATGLELESGKICQADLVICNADAATAYSGILSSLTDDPLAKRYRRLEPSSSGLVFLWGIHARFKELGVNNVFFSPEYSKDFEAAFNALSCPPDPTVYVNITSKVHSSDAPDGCENWFVLVNAPRDAGQNWAEEAQKTRKAVLSRLSAVLGRDIESLIRVERIITPPEIERQTSSAHGSLYGISSNSRLSAFLRHPNKHPRCKGLYLCGGSVHPGGGMPLALRSGMICADLVSRYEGGF